MRVIARRERPHPGAQLRLTDEDGWRITCFATNTKGWRLADLEVRHRQRARAEDRIRNLRDTRLRNLPFKGFAQNQSWLEVIALAADVLVWTQTLVWYDHPARRWEPQATPPPTALSCRPHHPVGAATATPVARHWPWNDLLDTGWAALQPG